MRLDRGWGTFQGISAMSFGEALSELYAEEEQNTRREFERQLDESDAEYNLLLDHYDFQCGLKSKAIRLLENLKAEFAELEEKYQRVSDENSHLKEKLIDKEKEVQSLRADNVQAVVDNKKLINSNSVLESRISVANRKYDAYEKDVVDKVQVLKRNKLTSDHNQKITENKFVLIQQAESAAKLEAMMGLKIAYTQSLILWKIVEKLIEQGVYTEQNFRSLQFSMVLEADKKDFKRNGITYSEAFNWLKVHNPDKLKSLVRMR